MQLFESVLTSPQVLLVTTNGSRAAEDRAGEGWALHRLAELSVEGQAPERAEAFAAAALTIAREIQDTELEARCAPVDPRGPAHST